MNVHTLSKDRPPQVAYILPHSCEFAYPEFFRQGKTALDFAQEIMAQEQGFAAEFARAAIAAGFGTTVYYFLERSRQIISLYHKYGYRLVMVPVSFFRGKIGWEYSLALFRILYHNRPDLAHIHGTNFNDGYPCMYDLLAFYFKLLKIPFIGHFHGSTCSYQRGLRRTIKRFALEAADRIVTCNEAEITRLCDPESSDYYGFRGIKRNRVEKLHNITEGGLFRAMDRQACRAHLGLEIGVKYLLSVGRLIERKLFENIVDMMLRLPKNTKLIIVGDGERRPALEQKVKELYLNDRVILAGTIANTQLPLYYSAADVFLMASRLEGLPIVIQEALSCHLPVIATDLDGVKDLLSDGVGITVPVADIDAMHKATLAVLSGQFQPNWQEADHRLHEHSFQSVVAHLKHLYNAVLEERRKSE